MPARCVPLPALLLFAAALPARCAVEVECAYYRIDIGGQYAWSENAAGLVDFAKQDRRAGILKVYVHNPDNEPADVEAVALNGTDLQQLRESDRHEVIWWRTWPNPVPAGGYAEVSVRLRYPLEGDGQLLLRAGWADMDVTIPARPPCFRIETVGWRDDGREVTIVAGKIRAEPTRIERVFLDETDVTPRASMPVPEFWQGVCPILLRLPQPLQPGSFHTYRLQAADGQQVACTLRTLDDYMRLGMYGAGDLETNLKLGINEASHFRPLSRSTLDEYEAFGLRSAFHVDPEAIDPQVFGHPAVYAYVLHDEPDCWDYGAKDWPAPMRIGYHAPEIVRHTRLCARQDPTKPVQITLDLTFKPANYYVYAQIPDIVLADCYPLTIGVPLAWVREVTRTCRLAAGPRRVETVPQVDFEDRHNTDMEFPRPPFPREVIIQYLYALGAGARGFSGWEWFDEKADWCTFYGAANFPDVLNAVGQVFRRFAMLRPLILVAHPTDIATCNDDRVWTKTLICGQDALLLVLVNDDYECRPKDFIHHPRQNVSVQLPHIPWLRPRYVAMVEDGHFRPLNFQTEERRMHIDIGPLDTGAIVLAADDRAVATELIEAYRKNEKNRGLALFAGYRRNQDRRAEIEAAHRYILGRYAQYAVPVTEALHAYGVEDEDFWNPTDAKYPGIEWWTEATPRGGRWQVTIPKDRANVAHTVYFLKRRWWNGGYLRIQVAAANGDIILQRDRPHWQGPVPNFRVTFPAAGEYAIRILHAGEGKPGGRLSRFIFVVPGTAAPLPGQAWQSPTAE